MYDWRARAIQLQLARGGEADGQRSTVGDAGTRYRSGRDRDGNLVPGDVPPALVALDEKAVRVRGGPDREAVHRMTRYYTEGSHRALLRRVHIAEARLKAEEEHNEHAREWALKAFDEQRRLGDRCTFLAELAVKLGATFDDLRGEQ